MISAYTYDIVLSVLALIGASFSGKRIYLLNAATSYL